jgi:hypothetical protein
MPVRDWDKFRRQLRAKAPEWHPTKRPKRLKLVRQEKLGTHQRLLKVTRPDGFSATAIWSYCNHQWICTSCDPALNWMKPLSAAMAGTILKERIFDYRWFKATRS